MYIPRHFSAQELIPPALYLQHGDRALICMDDRVLRTLDLLRDAFGPIIVNNWATGGTRIESGLREMGTDTGAPLSQHKFGRAADCLFTKTSAADVRSKLLNGIKLPNDPFRYITCIEDFPGMTWFHFDVRNHVGPLLVVGKPKT